MKNQAVLSLALSALLLPSGVFASLGEMPIARSMEHASQITASVDFELQAPSELKVFGSVTNEAYERDGAPESIDSEEVLALREGSQVEVLGVSQDESGETYLLVRIDGRQVGWVKEEESKELIAEERSLIQTAAKGFITPVKGRITSRQGMRFHPILKKMKYHGGTDYAAPTGTPVKAAASGKVTFSGWRGAYGKVIYIKHPNGRETRYAHLSAINVRNGQSVKQGQMIGKVGSTGRSTGPHLHYELR